MSCQRCQSERLISTSACVKDTCYLRLDSGQRYDGYVPSDIGMGDSDDDMMEWEYCLNCGQIQGQFPLPETQIEHFFNAHPHLDDVDGVSLHKKGYLNAKEQAREEKYKATHKGASYYGVGE